MTKNSFWEYIGDVLAALNSDVRFDTLVEVSATVLDRVLGDLSGGLDRKPLEETSPAFELGFTIFACLATALAWSALLMTLRLILLDDKEVPSSLSYGVAGLFMASVPLFFNGLGPTLLGVLAALVLKVLAAHELNLHAKAPNDGYLIGEFSCLNSDGEAEDGGLLALLNLGSLFPILRWGTLVRPFVLGTSRRLTTTTAGFQLSYQRLWYDKKYRRARKKIRHFFESPIRLRRYWYLTFKWGLRSELSWFGVAFRRHLKLKYRGVFLGLVLRKAILLAKGIQLLFKLRPIIGINLSLSSNLIKNMKRLWNERPSAIQWFTGFFQPEAPVYIRGGCAITPPARRPRLVNVVSDLEVFASRGSSLLVFMFLIWSFFARVLLVICFLGLL